VNSIPSRREAIKILRKVGCSSAVVKHSKKVAEVALKLAKKFENRGFDVNMAVVEIGALLHDIGRSRAHSVLHVSYGVELAKSFRLPDVILNAIERHIGAGIPAGEAAKIGLPNKDFMPKTLEEKIIAYADKLVEGDRVVSWQRAIKNLSKELGENHPAIERMRNLYVEFSSMLGEKL
jgi:uncharacterized protein